MDFQDDHRELLSLSMLLFLFLSRSIIAPMLPQESNNENGVSEETKKAETTSLPSKKYQGKIYYFTFSYSRDIVSPLIVT